MNIKNIIFDFGGVLIDWNPEYLYSKVFDDKNELKQFVNNVCPIEWNHQFDAGVPFQQGIDEHVKKYPQYKKELQMYKDRWLEMIGGEITENTSLIKPLKSKYNLFGLTNWSSETFYTVREQYVFFKEFDGIVVSGDEKVIKPDDRIYEILLSRYGLNSEECLFIDDNLQNIIAANGLGINTIHLTQNVNLSEELEKLALYNF